MSNTILINIFLSHNFIIYLNAIIIPVIVIWENVENDINNNYLNSFFI